MPDYFFDIDDGERADEDECGLSLPDMQAARRMAVETLPELARGRLSDENRRVFAIRVRDAHGLVFYSAMLEVVGEWHITPPGKPALPQP